VSRGRQKKAESRTHGHGTRAHTRVRGILEEKSLLPRARLTLWTSTSGTSTAVTQFFTNWPLCKESLIQLSTDATDKHIACETATAPLCSKLGSHSAASTARFISRKQGDRPGGQRSVRSVFDTCPNTAQRLATHQALCSALRESFWSDGGYRFYCGDQRSLCPSRLPDFRL
jgi:hypothetical protein